MLVSRIFKYLFFLSVAILNFVWPLALHARGDSEEISSPEDTHYAAIIKIDSEDAVHELEQEGVEILRRRDELLLCFVPYQHPPSGENRKNRRVSSPPDKPKGVKRIERGRPVTPNMDKAREWFDAASIHAGSPDFPPFTGKDVVAGICDIGIDPLHIAFLDSKDNPRIKKIVQYKEGTGERIVMTSKEEYQSWLTDTPDNWHATHVANIMAGGFGEYRGMAPEADIVVTTSQLTDVGLLCGAEDILEYAKEKGKRAVINMSMGNYTGPHDGSSLFCQYLDRIAEEALVVLSAGNSGNTDFTLPVDFSDSLSSASLALYSRDWVQFNPYGAVDIWGADDSPLRVRLGILDTDTSTTLILYPWQQLHDGERFCITSDPDGLSISGDEKGIFDETFASVYAGWFELQGGIDSENGRYQAILQYDAHTEITSSRGKWARYVPIIEISGEPGSHADIYADWQFTVFRALPDNPKPGSLLSFSDLATGHNVISVGMYVNRDCTPAISGPDITISRTPGAVAPESAYATLLDGRVMPSAVAPGYNVVSAMSRPFWEKHPDSEPVNAQSIRDNERYLWVTNHGTSMSAPYVAGTLACWLEAIPSLTSSQAREILSQTNRRDFADGMNPRYGGGYIDPAGGLKAALSAFSSTGVIFPDYPIVDRPDDRRRLSFSDGVLTFWNPDSVESGINIHDIAGNLLFSFSSSSTLEEFDISSAGCPLSGFLIASIPGTPINLKILSN